MKLKIITILFSFIAIFYTGKSQSGMQFADLALRLDPYFAKDLILDIKRQLPQGSDYTIWSWDVGDFSGDGYNDVAFAVKIKGDRDRNMQVYMFVDIEGYLTKVGQYQYKYVELPLEIGVVIRHNACFITKKNKQYDWLIRGYSFDNGTLNLLDEYLTHRVGNLTHEKYRNYLTLTGTEKYLETNSGDEEFFVKFLSIPSYQRGRQIYKGYPKEPYSYEVDYVHKGAFWWEGQEDASFTVSSAYDDKYLYMKVNVTDDEIVQQDCDTCLADRIDIWIDVLPPYFSHGDRFVQKKGNRLQFRTHTELGIYRVSFYPGDFAEEKSYFKIGSTDNFEPNQKMAVKNIKSVSNSDEKGFTMKFKIPFTLLGFDELPQNEDNEIVEFGCTLVYNDIDNKYRPEEETQIATSIFEELNPATYGSLLIVPNKVWYGQTTNIYKEDILKILMENGY